MTGQIQEQNGRPPMSFVPLGQQKGMSAKRQEAFIGAELAAAVAVIDQKGVGIPAR